MRLPTAVLAFFGVDPAMKLSFPGDGIHYFDIVE
jgi:hypothetical protein